MLRGAAGRHRTRRRAAEKLQRRVVGDLQASCSVSWARAEVLLSRLGGVARSARGARESLL
jgi:hypothetical protein